MGEARRTLLALATAFALAGPAGADEPSLRVELNGAKPVGEACRFDFVFRNGLGTAIGDLGLEIVVFDRAGAVERFTVIRSGSLPANKTRVRQFEFDKLACADVARLLVNDVKTCSGDGLGPELCLARLSVAGSPQIGLDL